MKPTRLIRRVLRRLLGMPRTLTLTEMGDAARDGLLAGFAAGPFSPEPQKLCTPAYGHGEGGYRQISQSRATIPETDGDERAEGCCRC